MPHVIIPISQRELNARADENEYEPYAECRWCAAPNCTRNPASAAQCRCTCHRES